MSLSHIPIDFATAIAGVWFISAAVIGFTNRPIGIAYRIILGIIGFSLLMPIGILKIGRLINIVGVAMALILIFLEFFLKRKN